ncbi:MAG: M48 family metallopeptidase [Anaerolineae bacterium]|nr:M48 family metallopeptidase [Anaerolineae bacterium]
MRKVFRTTTYRYPHEQVILALTLLMVLLVIAVTATATVCLSVIFVAAMLALSFLMTRSHHQSLLEKAYPVTPQNNSALAALVQESVDRLQPGPVQVFVAASREMNAYTFGLSSPKVVVLQFPILEAMDADEIRFILGHELGHVSLGHTWLNSLVGGMAGIPSPFAASIVLNIAFLWWNRACEFSADRAGMLACGNPRKAISALVKLEAGAGAEVMSKKKLEQVVARIEAEDDHFLSGLGEVLGTHPMTVRRIEELRRYATTAEYRRLRTAMDRNAAASGTAG